MDVDWPYIQHPTPYPRTPMTEQFRERGLIMNQQLEEYDGTTAVVRTEHVAAEEVEHQVLVRKSPSGSAGLRC
jgi:hypothetical protein